jgi:hypothetical protein
MALVCGSERILVDKVTLFTKLELFSKNPALLGFREYEVRSNVSSSVLSTFVELIGRTEFDIRDEDVEGLGRLAAELGHAALAAACRAQKSQRSECWEGLKGEITSMRDRQQRHEQELLSIREELASLRQSLSVRDQDVSAVGSVVSRLAARQKGDEREVEAIWSSVLSIDSLVKSVCDRNDQTDGEVSRVKHEVCELKGKVCSIENWREAMMTVLYEMKREVGEGLGREIESVRELRDRLSVEVAELRKEVGLLVCAKGRLEAEFAEVRKQFEAEQNYRRFCELCYGVHGCDKSFRLGIRLLELAADSGHSDAQHQYSRSHCEGSFVRRDYSICSRYAELSGSSGNATGQFWCGYCLYNGFGVVKDIEKAAGWYKLSADQGHARGEDNYGSCLENGAGVVKDLVKASEYYKMSADQGNAYGQYNYGQCLEYGKGAVKDLAQAARYYKLAAEQGLADAREGYCRCSGCPRN